MEKGAYFPMSSVAELPLRQWKRQYRKLRGSGDALGCEFQWQWNSGSNYTSSSSAGCFNRFAVDLCLSEKREIRSRQSDTQGSSLAPPSFVIESRKIFDVLTECWKQDSNIGFSSNPKAVLQNPAY